MKWILVFLIVIQLLIGWIAYEYITYTRILLKRQSSYYHMKLERQGRHLTVNNQTIEILINLIELQEKRIRNLENLFQGYTPEDSVRMEFSNDRQTIGYWNSVPMDYFLESD